MKAPVFNNGDVDADLVIVGAGVVGAMIADQLVGEGHSVVMLDAGPRLDRGQAVENWRNLPFESRAGSAYEHRSISHRIIMSPSPDRTPRPISRTTFAPSAARLGIGPLRAGVICRSIFE
jgi:choline dehydrogenase-like flavoprotein